MPRVAEGRTAAEPSSRGQRDRHQRVLEAAAGLAAERGLERVQMQEVAKLAGVAIATLYRYFPSKTHLFVAVMADQVGLTGSRRRAGTGAGRPPHEAVFEVLQRTNRSLLRRPALATAMITSLNAADPATVTDVGRVDSGFRTVILEAAGLRDPGPGDVARVRLLIQLWYGVLQSSLNGRIAMSDAESDLRMACRMLLCGLSNAPAEDS